MIHSLMKSLRASGMAFSLIDDRLVCRCALEAQREEAARLRQEQGTEIAAWLKRNPDFFCKRPLSAGQMALWAFYKLAPHSPAYNMVYGIELKAEIDLDRLGTAFARVLASFEALCCGYREEDGEVLMVRAPVLEPDFTVQRVERWDEAQVRAWLTRQADLPFALERAQVCRFRLLLNRAGTEARVFLCAAIHHIAGDFLSFELFCETVFRVYEELLHGQTPNLPESGLYWDWLAEQRQALNGPRGEELVRFWREQLADGPAPLALTTDFPRPREPSFAGEELDFALSEGDSAGLKALASELDVSLFGVLTAVFQVFMHRYADQDDFLVGTPTAGRAGAKFRCLIGYTLNAVPLRARCGGNPPFADFVRRFSQDLRAAIKHQQYPLPLIAEHCTGVSEGGRPTLFRHMLTLVPVSARAALNRYVVQEYFATQRGAANDLNLRWQDQGQRLIGQWRFSTDVFRRARIERMVDNFRAFIASVLAAPQARLSELQAVRLTDRSLLRGPDRAPAAETALAAFEHQAATSPRRLALVTSEGTLSYAELDAAAAGLAGRLWAGGLRPGDIVGLLLPRGASLITAVLAAWKVGAAYVCLDPAAPAGRLQHVLSDSGAALVAGCGSAPGGLDGVCWFNLEAADSAPGAGRAPGPALRHPDWPAYVVYTSGSTGVPKGVLVSQGNLVNYVNGVLDVLELTPDASLGALSSAAADLGYTAWFGALLSGRTLRLIDDDLASDPEALALALEQAPIDCLKIVPSHLKGLLAASRPGRLLPRQCLVLGGEGLDLGLIRRLHELRPGCRIVNHYGPTEATVGCLTHVVQRAAEPTLSGFVPIGTPLARTQLHVLDRYLNSMPGGAAGELYVGGAGVATGYLGQPGLTAERFIPDPFADNGSRLYRTGDRARLLPGGMIEFLGRLDHQVKIRGFRVEPGEIEAWFKACPELADAVVVARQGPTGEGLRLVAYLVAAGPVDLQGLRARMAAALPDHLIPAAFVELPLLPLLPNGKVDRQRLPEPEAQRVPADGALDAPRDAIEAALAELWAELLGCVTVSIRDDFFALGGDSILGLQLIAKARQRGLVINPKQLFEHPTIAALAQVIDIPTRSIESELETIWTAVLKRGIPDRHADFFALGGDSILALQIIAKAKQRELSFTPKELFDHPSIASLAAFLLDRMDGPGAAPGASTEPAAAAPFALTGLGETELVQWRKEHPSLEDAYALSPLQKGLLFHSLLEGESGVYFNQLLVEIEGAFEPERFVAGWQQALDAHAILRTAFCWDGLDEPLQCVHRKARLPVDIRDWRGLERGEQERALQAFCREDRQQGFDLEQPPLLRLALFRVGTERWWMVWSRHHLIVDGWCSVMLLEEVLERYGAARAGTPPNLVSRPPYRDYIAWLARHKVDDAQAFWRQALAGIEGPMSLPCLYPAAAGPTDYITRSLRFDAEASERLKQAAKDSRVTLNTLMQGAWGLLLARYSGQADVVFGVTSAGRPADLPGAEHMLGVFINTLPLRLQPADALSVQDYLSAVQSANVAMREFEQTPLVDIQQHAAKGAALFDTLMVFQNLPMAEGRQMQLGELNLRQLDNLVQTNYGLTLEVLPDRELAVQFSADRRRLPDAELIRLVEHYRQLLLALATRPQSAIGALSLLSTAERTRALDEWNRTARGLVPGEDMLALFERRAHEVPERVAAVFGAVELSYGELNCRANRLARWLRAAGVGTDSVVGVCLEREPALLVALLAIHKAGGAYLPIDPASPRARNAYVLEHATAVLVLTREALRPVLQGAERVTALEGLDKTLAELSDRDLDLPVHPRQLAYVLYTSGSTGRPKGVQVEREAFVNFLHAMQDRIRLGSDDRLLAVTTLSFDIAGLELFLPLVQGACVVVATREQALEPAALLKLMQRHGITLMQATPATWQMLVEHEAAAWAGLRVLCGGEALRGELAGRLLARGVRLLNVYGPTETTVWSSAWPVECVDAAVIPIGRPIANTRLYVLDARLEPVPPGVVGELYIGGAGLARGYAQGPVLSAAAFVPNPYSEAGVPGAGPGSRLYRTGDLARWRADGVLEYVGRIDHQVKLRGFRVELGEIEVALESLPAVREAVVTAREVPSGKRLVGYVVPTVAPGRAGLTEELQAQLKEALPEYMVPAQLVVLEKLPLMPNGKLDRKALPLPEPQSEAGLEPPATATERRLAALWRELLTVEMIGRQSHFFELGGHSLLATRLVSRLRRDWAVDLPLRTVFEAPTLSALATRLEQARAEEPDDDWPPLRVAPRGTTMSLSLSQQRLWLMDRLAGGTSSAYNMAAGLHLRGDLDARALHASLAYLIERHEVLRTAYPEIDGEAMAVISLQAQLEMSCTDLSGLSAAERDAQVREAMVRDARRPFDIGRAPLLRASLLKLDACSHLLLFAVHHMVADGWSVGVLINEFVAAYRARREGRPPALPPLPVQYADYAVWQRQALSGECLRREIEFWQAQLDGAPSRLPLTTDFPRPAVVSHDGGVVRFTVPPALVQRLDGLARAREATLFMVLLTGFQLLLHRLTGAPDLVLGTDVAGRRHSELEGLIGFFVNVVPLRSRLEPRTDFLGLLEQTRRTTLDVFEHQDLPFDRLVEALEIPRDRRWNPLVQVLFVLQNTPAGRFDIPGLDIEILPPAQRQSKFDMALFLEPEGDGLSAEWVYSTALFKRATVQRLARAWVKLLEQAAAQPHTALEQFTLPDEKESRVMDNSKRKLDKLKKLTPRASVATQTFTEPRALIRSSFLPSGREFPVVLEPTIDDLDPVAWARSQRSFIESTLCRHAGILFRNFGLETAQDFEAFAEAIQPGLYGGYGDLPKKEGGTNIYRSTPYPEQQMILFHNESSHLERWPRKQWFFCELASPVGGATPIVDCREMYRRLPPELIETFERKQLMYVRTFTDKLDVSWRDFFKTDDKHAVEARCRAAGTVCRWLENDELQIHTICPAVIKHPLTGECVFFNQVQLHHIFCLEPEVRADLLAMVGLERMPRHVYYGDGSPIEDGVMELIGQLYEECAVRFDWRQGDVIMLDNMLAAHARDPFEGPRRIVVAMAEMIEREQVAPADSAASFIPERQVQG
ncbi:non-ribosomal peptide synthetase [Nitrococcus mobilis]|uniref:Amino acid adenylation n=1 Tax=Nitrococcus mobilis Nb-231 TaxID=314278 RepID=A4BRH7_9GAMM|nr:non-ribosomal peptide synthetase [Nitrococcus mobilis]EAR21799.1 Amino acid adenylation [Nitrococcus mobilis Nb-231]